MDVWKLEWPERRNLFWVLQLSGWTIYGGTMLLATVPYLPLPLAALNKAINTAIGFTSSLGLFWICRRTARAEAGIAARATLLLAACYLLALLWSYTSSAAFLLAQGRSLNTMPLARYFDHATTQALALLTWTACYFGINQFLTLQAIKERALQSEALAREAELRALRYQLNPHFLFNSLNTIASLVVDRQMEAAHGMILRLSGFLRVTLEGGDDRISLGAEAAFVEHYLAIESIRFSDRLRYEIEISPGALDQMVPRMILQPLVENAIRHGLRRTEKDGLVRITGHQANGYLELAVADNGIGLGTESPVFGIGLTNTRRRLEATYGQRASIELASNASTGATAVLRIPISSKAGTS